MIVRGMIFDLDGTLGDTLPVCIAAYQAVFQQFLGQRLSERAITDMFGPSEEGVIRRLMPDHWQEGMNAYLAEYERLHAEQGRSFDGIDRMLAALVQRHVPLAVVSGKGQHSAAISLSYLGLAPYFDIVETGSAEGPIKPFSIARVLARWGMAPHEAAYVGDSPSDMDAAAEAGVLALGAAWGNPSIASDPAFARALATFTTVDTFVAWIETHILNPS